MGTIVSTRETQFRYFDQVLEHPVWRGRKILDFGGNVGGFLASAGDHIDLEDYWCLDLNHEVIEQGRLRYPRAHFFHYNRYSSQYNPNGLRELPVPDLGLRFDLVLAFSVFTHTHQTEMLELVEQLHRQLAPEGVIAFTFTDPRYDRSLSDPKLPSGTDVRKILEWRQAQNPYLDIESMVETARQSNWCLVIDDKLHVEPGNNLSNQAHQGKPWESYCSYFTVDYMASLFRSAKVFPPVSPEWQHCCVLRKTV
jgi:SAM-dependent methyltransferase